MKLSRRGLFGAMAAAPVAASQMASEISAGGGAAVLNGGVYAASRHGLFDPLVEDGTEGHTVDESYLKGLRDSIADRRSQLKALEKGIDDSDNIKNYLRLHDAEFSCLRSVSLINVERMRLESLRRRRLRLEANDYRRAIESLVKEYTGAGGLIDFVLGDEK